MEITREIAEKLRDVVDAGLVRGVGKPIPGQMCVEAAVCFALGLPHGDDPGCVSQSLRELKIRLNDAEWSSDRARARGMRRLALIQLGSAGVLDEIEFAKRVATMTIRKIVPLVLRVSASQKPEHAEALEAAAVRCEVEGSIEAADAATYAANAATYAADAAAATYAANAATYAADAANAATYAANAATYATYAANAATYAADAAAARDTVLSQFAEWVVEILIDMQVPGCQWLDLVPVSVEAPK